MSYEKKRNSVFILTYIFTSIYLVWRIFFTLPFSAGVLQIIFGVLLLLSEVITTLGSFELYYHKMRSGSKELEMPEVPDELWPDVDVFIATHNEPPDILARTVNACTYMEYPDREKVHIYLCDDGDRREVEELARRFGVGYLGLSGNIHAKSGNYNNAMAKTASPLIATFDADMIPQRKFLVRTVPYFFLSKMRKEDGKWRAIRKEDEEQGVRLGLLQTPQSFYNQDLFQFNLYAGDGIPNEQDFFSNEINVMRNATNSCAYTGSNTLLLRSAMEEIGGFPCHTVTEDFETSLRLQKAGYITYATSEILAAGLSTTDFAGMVKQRVRWAQGVIQSIHNTNAIFTSKLSAGARLSYLNAYLYWWSFLMRMIFILAPILFALFDFQLVSCSFGELAAIWLPSYLCSSLSMRYLSSNVRSFRWSQVIDTVFAPYLIVPVILESVGIRQKKFKVTDKSKRDGWTTSPGYMLPHLALLVLSAVALIRFSWGKYGMSLVYSMVILFWLCVNLISLIYAVLFMMGRESKRKYDRIKADENVRIQSGDVEYAGRTVDVSEEGIAFRLSRDTYIPEDEAFTVLVDTEDYHARLNARLVYVRYDRDGWIYSVQVSAADEKNWREWMQVIHDRMHSLPREVDQWLTVYDDITRNIRERLTSRIAPRRKTARFSIARRMNFSHGASGFVRDYNHRYFSVAELEQGEWDGAEELSLTARDFKFRLRRSAAFSRDGEWIELFEVLNHRELALKGVSGDEVARALKEAA